MLGLRRTLKIASRTLSDVVVRVRLCGHHTHRSSRGEVHVYVYVYGAVMRRWGEGGDRCCTDSVLKTPEQQKYLHNLGCVVAGIPSHSKRSGNQSEILWSHPRAITR